MTHSLEFLSFSWQVYFEIDNNETPYQRSRFGAVKTELKVKMTFSGLLSKSVTKNKFLFVTASHSKDVDLALSHSRVNRSFAEGLGPVFTSTSSQNLSVGGYIRFGLSLPNSDPTLKLLNLELTLIQNATIKSRSSDKLEIANPVRLSLLVVDGESMEKRQPLSRTEEVLELQRRSSSLKSQGFENDWVARIPDDNSARRVTSQVSVNRSRNVVLSLSIDILLSSFSI